MQRSAYFGISLCLMCAAWAGAAWVETRPAAGLAKPLDSIDRHIDGWVGMDDPPLTESILASLRPSSYISRTYYKGTKSIGLFVAYYSLTRPGESMHSPKNCLPGGGWEILESGFTYINVGQQRFGVNKYSIQKNGDRQLVLYWYQSRERIVASEYAGKLFRAWDAISSGDTSGSLVRVLLPATPGALEEGQSFAARVVPAVQRALGSATIQPRAD
ncbi:MAG TPA: EpsI family protein [Candidatus Angelobacter sp.]|nr:EpsI family protein [Candidatus Angelobacter sp.]